MIIILVGPSAVGKSTISKELNNQFNFNNIITYTTRTPRKNEINNVDYNFITENEFKKLINSDFFIEYQKVHNNYYGTSKEDLILLLKNNNSILLILDINGAQKIKEMFPEETIIIFIAPVTMNELYHRLTLRKLSEDEIQTRMKTSKIEMTYCNSFDLKVINYKIQNTVDQIGNFLLEKTNGVPRIDSKKTRIST